MKYPFITLVIISITSAAFAQVKKTEVHPYLSLKSEIEHAINKGTNHLRSIQHSDGYWENNKLPAYTALVISAQSRNPQLKTDSPLPDSVKKGLAWLRKQQKDDGGIYVKGLANYNTATSLMALLAAGQPEDEAMMLKARRFLINQQSDFDIRGKDDNKYDGGIGYGGTYAHSDLSNTHLCIEALHHSRHLIQDTKANNQPKLNWDAALTFVSRCQNLPGSNDQEFASDDPDNKGGFVYFPGSTKAGEQTLANGRTALRSYGSMSYAGLLSLIYSNLDPNDPRIKAVVEWLGKNYTLEENPGLGPEGLYYYYQAMSKALSAAKIDHLPLANGKHADWRRDLARKLITAQRENGSWVNENSRWFEGDPALVTAYALITLENIYYSIPEYR